MKTQTLLLAVPATGLVVAAAYYLWRAASKLGGKQFVVPASRLQEGIKDLLAAPGPHFVLFSADPDPATGKSSWCPDCVRCVPAIKTAVKQTGGSLLEVLVGERAAWKSPSHPFRLDPAIKLTTVPTLVRWSAAGAGARDGGKLEDTKTEAEALAVARAFVRG